MITWNDLTAEQQQVLEMLPVSVLPNQRELYDAHKGVIHQLVEMHLARPTLTTYKRITDGDYVLAQKPAQKPAQQPANDSGAAVDVSALQAENARLQRELEAARTALENIADYDVKYEHGFIDEWNEAESFTIVQKIAADALAAKAGSK